MDCHSGFRNSYFFWVRLNLAILWRGKRWNSGDLFLYLKYSFFDWLFFLFIPRPFRPFINFRWTIKCPFANDLSDFYLIWKKNRISSTLNNPPRTFGIFFWNVFYSGNPSLAIGNRKLFSTFLLTTVEVISRIIPTIVRRVDQIDTIYVNVDI